MTMLQELLAELIGMFFGERQLSIAILAVVAMAGSLVNFVGLDPLIAGAVLVLGCPILLVENVCRAARARTS